MSNLFENVPNPTPTLITWDGQGQKKYELGVDHGVMCRKQTADAIAAWNGLTNVTENPSGAEATDFYADNILYATILSAEKMGLTIECYTYPTEFNGCLGLKQVGPSGTYGFIGQQTHEPFDFSWRSKQGDDQNGVKAEGILHIAYGCKAKPSSKAYATIGETPEPATMSYEVTCTPIQDTIGGAVYNTAVFTLDLDSLTSTQLTAINNLMYATTVTGGLPLPSAIIAALGS